MSSSASYIIVGSGVFGVSTAYHLIKKYPNASVTLVDRDAFDAETRVAASWDWNKVVRADYDDIVYCKLGIEAQDVFNSDPLWKPYFHQTGIFWTCRDEYAGSVIGNYGKLGRKADLKAVPVNEAKNMFGGVFDQADYSGVKEVLVNRTSGWAAAGDCLQAVTRETLRLGVKYVTADVASLEFDSQGRCRGLKTSKGQTLNADHVILSTGAFTPKLLELSAQSSGNKKLSAEGRIVAGGITTGMTRLEDEDYRHFAAMPVGVQGYTAQIGPFIGSLPPTKDRELKWWGQTIFSNHREVAPGRTVSMPPPESDYAQWKVSKRLKQDIDHANHVFYAKKGANWKMDKYRICWDAFTTSGGQYFSFDTVTPKVSSANTSSLVPDFIISPHSAAKSLYIATCGNFHGWKFFPIIGKYVVQMLDGELEKDLAEKWSWDREWPDPAAFADWPRHEMRELTGEARL